MSRHISSLSITRRPIYLMPSRSARTLCNYFSRLVWYDSNRYCPCLNTVPRPGCWMASSTNSLSGSRHRSLWVLFHSKLLIELNNEWMVWLGGCRIPIRMDGGLGIVHFLLSRVSMFPVLWCRWRVKATEEAMAQESYSRISGDKGKEDWSTFMFEISSAFMINRAKKSCDTLLTF